MMLKAEDLNKIMLKIGENVTISFHAERPVFDLCKQPSYLSSVVFVKQ